MCGGPASNHRGLACKPAPPKIKKVIFNAVPMPILVYEVENWLLTEVYRRKIRAQEMKTLRAMNGNSMK